MKKMQIYILALLCAMMGAACGSDDPMSGFSELERQLCEGYWHGYRNIYIRFNADKTFAYADDEDAFAADEGSWRVDDGNILFTYSRDKWEDSAPDAMINVSVVNGKLYYTDEDGDSRTMTNGEASTFIEDNLMGHTFYTDLDWQHKDKPYHRSRHGLTFLNENTVAWQMKDYYRTSAELIREVKAHLYMERSITGESVQFYCDGNAADQLEMLDHYFLFPPILCTKFQMTTDDEGATAFSAYSTYSFGSQSTRRTILWTMLD